MKVNWAKFRYKSAYGMVLAALEFSINEKVDGYETLIPILTWWMQFWTDHPKATYEECQSEYLKVKTSEAVAEALDRFLDVVDPNLFEFVFYAQKSFC